MKLTQQSFKFGGYKVGLDQELRSKMTMKLRDRSSFLP